MTVSNPIEYKIGSSDERTKSHKYLPQSNDINGQYRQLIIFQKLGSVLANGLSSSVLIIINKIILTSWQFPSFIVIISGQMAVAIIILFVAKKLKIISFSDFTWDLFKKLHPLPIIYLGKMVSGLGAIQAMSLPMYTALRQFTVLMTMLLEIKILGHKPSAAVGFSIWCMITGAILAAIDDLSFTISGYLWIMLSNLLTAAYCVYIKEKITIMDIGNYGIIYYSSLLMFVPLMIFAWLNGDLYAAYNFENWTNPMFFIQFLVVCFMGFVSIYSTFLCSQFNSALTTAMVGCLKNVFISFLGMIDGGDYIFSIINCIGINISSFGSIFYTFIIFTRKEIPQNDHRNHISIV